MHAPCFHKNSGWILSKNKNEVTEGNYGFLISGGQIRATMNIGGRGNSYSVRSSHHTVVADKWHHVAMSYDGKTFSLYMFQIRKKARVIKI